MAAVAVTDAFEPFEPVLAARALTDPWRHAQGEAPIYSLDYELLEQLLSVPVRDGSLVVSGRFALGRPSRAAAHIGQCAARSGGGAAGTTALNTATYMDMAGHGGARPAGEQHA